MKTLKLVTTMIIGLAVIPGISMGAADDQTKTGKKVEAKVVDPVCSMEVDPRTAEKAVYKGKTYYFCSKQEKGDFEKSPEKYLKTSPKKK